MLRWSSQGLRPQFAGSRFTTSVFTSCCLVLFSCILLQGGCEYLGITYKDAGKSTAGSDSSGSTDPADGNNTGQGSLPVSTSNPSLSHRSLMVGSFNIKMFGEKKYENQNVVAMLQDLAYPFDLLAIQEVRGKNFHTMEKFVAGLNQAKKTKFRYIASPWLGNSTQVEQCAFLYDATRLEQVGEAFVLSDPENKISREPLVARFQVRSHLTGTGKPFSFLVVNVHTKPDDAVEEMDYVASLVSFVKTKVPDEDDILVLGDFNLDPKGIFEKTSFKKMIGWNSVLGQDVKTNVKGTESYDNILLASSATQEFQGKADVINMKEYFKIDEMAAGEISDHRPIWAVFSLTESVEQTAASPSTTSTF